jgi:hypothetical protein
MRIGQVVLDHATQTARECDLDRSRWAEKAISSALQYGLPASISTQYVIDAMRRDGRCLIRINKKLKARLAKTAEQIGLPAATVALIAMIGELQRHEKAKAEATTGG